jgi:Skp family chaperone for outer membrane proteins
MNKLFLKSLSTIFMFLFFLTGSAYSLELSLESNKAESGTVGYVDIDLVFKKYSLTNQQKDFFKKKVQEKETFINAKKKSLFALKAEINQLKQEKEFALRLPLLIENQKKLNQISSSSTVKMEASTQTLSNIPSASTTTIKNQPEKPVIDMPGISNVPLNYFNFSVSTSAAIIENVIIAKSAELKKVRKEIEIYRSQAELELLDFENRQTENILGKIYMILKELAIKEGVSVVIDKRSILFGNYAVDLTDKLLLKLEEENSL